MMTVPHGRVFSDVLYSVYSEIHHFDLPLRRSRPRRCSSLMPSVHSLSALRRPVSPRKVCSPWITPILNTSQLRGFPLATL